MYNTEKLLDIVKRINELNNIVDNEDSDKETFDKAIDEFADIKTDLIKDWYMRFDNDVNARFALDNALDLYYTMEVEEEDDRYKLNEYMKNRIINMSDYDILEFESVILHDLRWVMHIPKKESDK
jgi:hypothetical protein